MCKYAADRHTSLCVKNEMKEEKKRDSRERACVCVIVRVGRELSSSHRKVALSADEFFFFLFLFLLQRLQV
jgi:hypothetical protein